ncbi:uncharacterized protein LOC141656582 [Silene latifolia]|uniref:uncharacterized protein LOC141656582 n=1 Tax=Silene latifolia TaxID=37657 RepID=UPI003D77C380
MGREWYFNWGSKSSSKKSGATKGGGGGRDGIDKRSGKPEVVATAAAAVAASGGCMNAVLHMFDFHPFHLCLHPNNNSYIHDDPIPLKGVEAPRNSLESITEDEKDNYLNIPMDIQIKTNRRDRGLKLVQAPRGKVEDTLSQSSCSPTSARTPTLVARLMGLEILPESNNTTPRSSSSYSHITPSTPPSRATKTRPKSSSYNNDILASRPKTLNSSSPSSSSSQRRRSTDVIDQHRLSLQINKENNIVKEMELSRPSCSAINTKRREGRKYEDENKSPGYYARQIMKQVKETVSRRVGADITNTIQQREVVRRDEHLLSKTPLKSKKSRKEASLLLSTSPKLIKTSETNNKVSGKQSNSVLQEMGVITNMDDKVHLKPLRRENEKFEMDFKKVGGTGTTNKLSSKIPPKSYDYPIKNKKDEQFVRSITRVHSSNTDKKCKKTPLSSDLVHASVPSIIPLKKDSSSQEKLTNISTTMNTTTRLFRGPSQQRHRKANKEATDMPAVEDKDKTTPTSTSTSLAECQYISKILKCTGIDRDTPVSFTRWFSPSNPLDPTIYHTIEGAHYLTTTNPNRSSSDANLSLLLNRKLIFHLVDEILADMVKPYRKFKPFHNRYHQQKPENINGFQLVKLLCTKLQSFPSKDCQTLQDIDALVEKDMPRFGEASEFVAFEDEGEAIVEEIEGDIIDSLVQEMAMAMSFSMQR